MSEATSIKASVSVAGLSGSRSRRLLTLETVITMIRNQGLDDYTTEGLIELASRYPTQALPSFRKNFNLMIDRVRQKRRAEMRGMENQPQKEDQHGEEESNS